MAVTAFHWTNFIIRLLVAIVLVFSTYNPSGYSWVHWFMESTNKLDPLIILSAVILIIGWAIYLRATARSLGVFGSLLVVALFGSIIWAMIFYGWLSLDNPSILGYVALTMLSLLLAVGISWSHIRRRITGQIDVDDVESDA
ncbi:MAG TPA: hypothetical protein ENG92_00890 [Thiolapillus brandeum]|uniref:Uncharacterized protein n=1 Tax=Thiolapillus brandeum TaxID=1076588 RepID=A0A831JWD3_9GAMM|nr:hypothetical protein [Thiolapillus brandeum]